MFQVRCRKENVAIRLQTKTHNLVAMNKVLSSLYNGNTKKNTTVMELNTTQYNRLKDHCIMVSKLRNCSDLHHIYYDNIIFGKKISLTKESTKFGMSKKNIWVNVHKTKSLVLITAPKVEFLKTFPNTHMFGTVMTYNNKTTKGSGQKLT